MFLILLLKSFLKRFFTPPVSRRSGGVELVGNGTRRRTRDVGTTFPSPQTSSSSLERGGRGGWRSPSKSQGSQKQRKSKRSPAKTLPEGTSDSLGVCSARRVRDGVKRCRRVVVHLRRRPEVRGEEGEPARGRGAAVERLV